MNWEKCSCSIICNSKDTRTTLVFSNRVIISFDVFTQYHLVVVAGCLYNHERKIMNNISNTYRKNF